MISPLRLCLFAAICVPLLAQETGADLLEAGVLRQLGEYEEGFDGALGVAVVDMVTGHSFALHGDTLFPQASEIKIPILMAMFDAVRQRKFRFDDPVTIDPKQAVGGSGNLQFALKKGPVTMTVRELVTAMIEHSDNTATNRCIDMIGMDRINAMLDSLGFPKTRLQRRMMDGDAAVHNRENISTPNEMARMIAGIKETEMLNILRKVNGGIRQGVPLDTDTASKTGEIPGARCETGIVFLPHRPFAISIQSTFIDDRRTPVPDVTRIVYRMFEKLDRSNRYGHTVR